jgi:hypothetical protein
MKAMAVATAIGVSMIAFGWLYPHFLESHPATTYLFAAPTGVIPCPTLSLVIGFALLSGGLVLTMLVTGVLTGFEARQLAAGEATPWFGLTERISIGAYLLWVLVLAISLLRGQWTQDASSMGRPRPTAAPVRKDKLGTNAAW